MKKFEFNGKPAWVDDSGISFHENSTAFDRVLDYDEVLAFLFPDLNWLYSQEDEYQGEWFAVGIDDDGRYFFQLGTFGSCSGCDVLQGIINEEGAKEFLTVMNRIIPIGNKYEAIAYLNNTKENVWHSAKPTLDKLIKLIEARP